MGERDAFGREKGEDTLADMGWAGGSSSGLSSDAAPPVERPASPDEPLVVVSTASALDAGTAARISDAFRSASAQPVPVRRARPGRVIIPLVLVGIIAAAGFGATAAMNAGQDALDDFNSAVRDAVPDVVEEPPEAAPAAEDPEAEVPPAESAGGSMLRPAAMRAALKQLPDGDLVMIRVSSDRISAQIKADDGLHLVTVAANGEVSDLKAPANLPDLGRLKVNAAAPNRIARAAARRAKQKVSDVDYLVLVNIPGGEASWQLYFKDGVRYTANASGRNVRKAG